MPLPSVRDGRSSLARGSAGAHYCGRSAVLEYPGGLQQRPRCRARLFFDLTGPTGAKMAGIRPTVFAPKVLPSGGPLGAVLSPGVA